MDNEKIENNATAHNSSAANCYTDDTLTPEQVENWRRVLLGMIGPCALMMPIKDIQRFRDKMQKDVNKIGQTKSV